MKRIFAVTASVIYVNTFFPRLYRLMRRKMILILLVLPWQSLLAQDSLLSTHRAWWLAAAHTGLYGGSLLVLNEAWYKGYPKRGFTSFDDSREWLQVDKVGHAWSAYNLSRASTASWRWAGLSNRKAAWAGTGSGFAFLSVIELLDAHSAEWGWSWSDMLANGFGSGLFLSQQLAWGAQRIQFKYSFHPKKYTPPDLETRARQLFGKPWYEQLLKDYNGQTYWLSASPRAFFPKSAWPDWLNIAVGYGADGLMGGFDNKAYDEAGNLVFDRTDIPRRRQFYLAPDIDLTRIKTRHKWLRTTLFILNAFKIPAPALSVTNKGSLRFQAIYF